MTIKQVGHMIQLAADFEKHLRTKYARGAAEHGGNLWELSAAALLDEAINECVDQYTYLMTLKEKLK